MKAEELLAFPGTLSYFHIHPLQRHIGGPSLLSGLACLCLKQMLTIDLQ